MKIFRRTETKVRLTEIELMEALGLNGEGHLVSIKSEWVADYHRANSGANVIEASIILHRNDFHRKASPRRKR